MIDLIRRCATFIYLSTLAKAYLGEATGRKIYQYPPFPPKKGGNCLKIRLKKVADWVRLAL